MRTRYVDLCRSYNFFHFLTRRVIKADTRWLFTQVWYFHLFPRGDRNWRAGRLFSRYSWCRVWHGGRWWQFTRSTLKFIRVLSYDTTENVFYIVIRVLINIKRVQVSSLICGYFRLCQSGKETQVTEQITCLPNAQVGGSKINASVSDDAEEVSL